MQIYNLLVRPTISDKGVHFLIQYRYVPAHLSLYVGTLQQIRSWRPEREYICRALYMLRRISLDA